MIERPVIKYNRRADMQAYCCLYLLFAWLFCLGMMSIMIFVIYYPIFSPILDPGQCSLDKVEYKDPLSCNINGVNTALFTFTFYSNATGLQDVKLNGCASYYARDSIVGGPSNQHCYNSSETTDGIYPYTFHNNYPLWWCEVCSTPDCMDTTNDLIASSANTTIPCWHINTDKVDFVSLASSLYVDTYQATYAWIAVALLSSFVAFHYTMEDVLNHVTITVYNATLTSSWFRFNGVLLFLLSTITDVLYTWWTFANFHLSPNSSFSIVSYLTFCMWLTWVTTKIAKISSLIVNGSSLSLYIPLLDLFVIFFGLDSSFPLCELSDLLTSKILDILFLGSWTKFLPLIIASAYSTSSTLSIVSLVTSISTLCIVSIQYSKILLFKEQASTPLKFVVSPVASRSTVAIQIPSAPPPSYY